MKCCGEDAVVGVISIEGVGYQIHVRGQRQLSYCRAVGQAGAHRTSVSSRRSLAGVMSKTKPAAPPHSYRRRTSPRIESTDWHDRPRRAHVRVPPPVQNRWSRRLRARAGCAARGWIGDGAQALPAGRRGLSRGPGRVGSQVSPSHDCLSARRRSLGQRRRWFQTRHAVFSRK